MKRTLTLIGSAALFSGFTLSQYSTHAEPVAPAGISQMQVTDNVRSIRLPEDEPALPEQPGREITQLTCGTCHTTRYIMIQPAFSRDTWITEVTKMRKSFSAPISEEKIGEIVDYLMAVRGAPNK